MRASEKGREHDKISKQVWYRISMQACSSATGCRRVSLHTYSSCWLFYEVMTSSFSDGRGHKDKTRQPKNFGPTRIQIGVHSPLHTTLRRLFSSNPRLYGSDRT